MGVGVLATAPVRAQTNFRPGYVLPATGDTLRGEVDLRDARASAQRCQFRTGPQAAPTTYAPVELRGYGITAQSRHFRSHTVTLPQAKPQAYFLEVLADGAATLYFLRDEQQHEFYFLAATGRPLALLEHSVTQVMRDGRMYNEENNAYRGTLQTYLPGCEGVKKAIPRSMYQEGALRRVVDLYNACQGQPARLSSGV